MCVCVYQCPKKQRKGDPGMVSEWLFKQKLLKELQFSFRRNVSPSAINQVPKKAPRKATFNIHKGGLHETISDN